MWAALLFGCAAAGCAPADPPPAPPAAFYHWQTRLAPDSLARVRLATAGSDRLYVKAFDVSWQGGRPEPTARVELADTVGLPRLIPVVFVTNEVFARSSAADITALADDVIYLVNERFGAAYPELQIDCDWTARTQVPYFDFLGAVRDQLGGRALSCTVRLHQYKDPTRQGVPPADYGSLMAYNVGDLDDWATPNSIADTTVLKRYLTGAPHYPLPLDVAVAVYDWAAVYRYDRLAYLINEPPLRQLADTSRFLALPAAGAGGRWRVRRSTYLDGTYLYAGDLLRWEAVTPAVAADQLAVLRRHALPTPGRRVLYYRLGSRAWGGWANGKKLSLSGGSPVQRR